MKTRNVIPNRTHFWLLLVFPLLFAPWGRMARGSVASDVRALTEAHTRLVWLQIVPRNGGAGETYRILGLDSDDGQGARTLYSSPYILSKPIITPSGGRVIFSNRIDKGVYVINWDGSGLRKLLTGYATDSWRDATTGIEWVYARLGDGKMNNPIWRYPIDHPAKGELIWNKTWLDSQDFPWFQVAADGRHASAAFPWPYCGVATLPNGSWQSLGQGCWPSLSPDGNQFFYFDGAHRHAIVHDLDGSSRVTVALNGAPGINGSSVFFPKWTRDDRFITVTGPSYMDRSELYLGKFNSDFNAVDKWVQITHNNVPDNWGDVWIAPGLGFHSGKIPLTVEIHPEDTPGDWFWDFGDGTIGKGETGKHTYTKAGDYTITARRIGRDWKGWIHARPAVHPQVTAVHLLDETHLRADFSEGVQLQNAAISLENGGPVAGWTLDPEGLHLLVALKAPVLADDWLHLNGVRDRAQVPNGLEPDRIALERPTWPANLNDLALLWETGVAPNLLYNSEVGAVQPFAASAEGMARLDRNGAMKFTGGYFHSASADFQQMLLSGVRKRSEMTIEAQIRPSDLRQGTASSPAAILYYGPSAGPGPTKPNFLLAQAGNSIVLSLNTDDSRAAPILWPIPICTLPDEGTHHLLVSYKPGMLTCYLDGKPAGNSAALKGELDWGSYPLYFGAAGVMPTGETGRSVWHGTLEGVAIFTHSTDEAEASAESAGYAAKIAGRKVAPQVQVQARLVALSSIPHPAEIAPYHSALVVYEYQVQRVLRGAYSLGKIRVAHWGLLDLHPASISKEMIGGVYNLNLEPFDQHPELEPEFLKDTLPPNYDLPLYFDVGN